MGLITTFLSAGLLVWFALLAMLIAMRILQGDVNTSGFLTEKDCPDATPERVVAMAVFPFIVIGYVIAALN